MPNIQGFKTFFPHKHIKISNSKNFLSNKTFLLINYFIVFAVYLNKQNNERFSAIDSGCKSGSRWSKDPARVIFPYQNGSYNAS